MTQVTNNISEIATGETTTRAADKIVAVLEERIFSGELKDGDMLPAERELIESFSVSRTVTREVVNILAGKGLIETRPRHRPVIRKPKYSTVIDVMSGLVKHLTTTPSGIKDLFEVRIFVEASLVRLAANEATKEDIKNLRLAVEHNKACIEDSEAFYESDMAFHAILYTISTNEIFPAIHKSFVEWLSENWRKMPRLPDRNLRNYQAHKAILDAIMERDPDAAETALRAHLADAWQQVEHTFEKTKDHLP